LRNHTRNEGHGNNDVLRSPRKIEIKSKNLEVGEVNLEYLYARLEPKMLEEDDREDKLLPLDHDTTICPKYKLSKIPK